MKNWKTSYNKVKSDPANSSIGRTNFIRTWWSRWACGILDQVSTIIWSFATTTECNFKEKDNMYLSYVPTFTHFYLTIWLLKLTNTANPVSFSACSHLKTISFTTFFFGVTSSISISFWTTASIILRYLKRIKKILQ